MALKKSTCTLLCIPLAVLLLLEVVTAVGILRDIFVPSGRTKMADMLGLYMWTAIGAAAYGAFYWLVMNRRWPFRSTNFRHNLNSQETFMHERTHQLVALALGRRLHSFHSEENTGHITTSGNERTHVFVSLAPYCLPIITYVLVFIRMMVAKDFLWMYDIMVGLSIGFHTMAIYKDIGNHQTDINQYPLYFSYLYIYTFLLLNICVLLVSYWPDENLLSAFWYMLKSFGTFLAGLWSLVFHT